MTGWTQVKEQLKRHAASQPRVANAVLLRAGEYAGQMWL